MFFRFQYVVTVYFCRCGRCTIRALKTFGGRQVFHFHFDELLELWQWVPLVNFCWFESIAENFQRACLLFDYQWFRRFAAVHCIVCYDRAIVFIYMMKLIKHLWDLGLQLERGMKREEKQRKHEYKQFASLEIITKHFEAWELVKSISLLSSREA